MANLPFNPTWRIFFTGIKMSLPVASIAVYYLYQMTNLTAEDGIKLGVFVFACINVEFIVKWFVQRAMTPHIRALDLDLKNDRIPSIERLQNAWVETINLPLKIVLVITFLLTAILVVLPTNIYFFFFMARQNLWQHFLTASILTIVTLSIINILMYERALTPLLSEIEKLADGNLNWNDKRIIFVTLQVKFIIFFVVIIIVLCVMFCVLLHQKVSQLTLPNIDPLTGLQNLKFEMLKVSLGVVLITTLLIYLLVKHQLRPLNQIRLFMRAFADGDADRPFYSSMAGVVRDEDNLLTEVFSDMTVEFRKVLLRVKWAGAKLRQERNLVASYVYDYKEAIQSQTEIGQVLTASMENLESYCLRLSEESRQIVIAMDAANDKVSAGREMIKKVGEGIVILKEKSNQTQFQIEVLQEKLIEINEIASIIRKVANQTQIIAFNAYLEAADEEEEARYSYIADSINTLTVQITNAAQQVRNIVHDVQSYSQTISSLAEREFLSIQNEALSSDQFRLIFEGISNSVDKMSKMLKQIEDSTASQNNVYKRLSESLNDNTTLINKNEIENETIAQQINNLHNDLNSLYSILDSFFPIHQTNNRGTETED